MEEIIFVTHNKGKIESAKRSLKEVNFKIYDYELDEPRSDDINFISEAKVRQAYEIVKKPCIALDAGFFIQELNDFPKAFVNFALETIGLEGILKLMEGKQNRKCEFRECLSYYDGIELKQFVGIHKGTLTNEILGEDTEKKWSKLWYIYIPDGSKKTLAEMSDEERENRDKDSEEKSNDTMREFAKWYRVNKI